MSYTIEKIQDDRMIETGSIITINNQGKPETCSYFMKGRILSAHSIGSKTTLIRVSLDKIEEHPLFNARFSVKSYK
jgi:hypothetical protein